jgi:hypothetical protein
MLGNTFGSLAPAMVHAKSIVCTRTFTQRSASCTVLTHRIQSMCERLRQDCFLTRPDQLFDTEHDLFPSILSFSFWHM